MCRMCRFTERCATSSISIGTPIANACDGFFNSAVLMKSTLRCFKPWGWRHQLAAAAQEIRFVLVALFVGSVSLVLVTGPSHAAAPSPISGSLASIPAGTAVDLTQEGQIDWVHWGLYTETSLDRKAGVVPQISDYTPQDSPTGFVFIYQFGDNFNGYTWRDGTPTSAVTNSTTGVWAYGTPLIGSG